MGYMTTPNVQCTCMGTCHPPSTFGHSIDPYAVGVLTQNTRCLIAHAVQMQLVNGDTGSVHGPNPR